MRIALVNSIRFLGGGEKRTLRASREFGRRGHEVTVLAPRDSELERCCRAEGLVFHPVEFGRYYAPSSIRALATALRKTSPHVVVCYDERSARIGALAAGRVPVVYYLGLEGSFKNKPYNRLVVAPRVRRFVANAEATRDELARFGWIAAERLHVIHNGVDPAPIDAADPSGVRAELGACAADVVVLVVARLVPEKGHDFLLPVLAQLAAARPTLKVWFAGDGPEQERLQAEIGRLHLGQTVRLLGFRADVPRLLRAADVLCHPSRREGAPNAVREAMVASLPVAAVSASGTPEVVSQGETGLLSAVGDSEALRANLEALLDSPELRRRLGEAGRHRALTVFSEDRCAEQWLRLLEGCVSG